MKKTKRSRGMTGKYAKQLREDMGLTQKELGLILNRNASNISRFERGITSSKDLENAYRRLERSFDTKIQLMYDLKMNEEEVRARMNGLFKYKEDKGEQYLSPAGEYFINNIGMGVFDFDIHGKDWVNQDIQTLRHNLSEVEKFLDSHTSDVEGYKDYKKRLLRNAQSVSGLRGKKRNELYWGVYNKLKNDKKAKMLERLGLSGGEHFSEQLEIEISVVLDKMGTDHTVDEVVEEFLSKNRPVDDERRNEIITGFQNRKKWRRTHKK